MKNRFAHHSLIALALAGIPLLNGCTQQGASNPPTYVTTSAPPPVVTQVVPVPATIVAAPAHSEPAAPAAAAVPPLIVTNAAPLAEAAPVLPANLRISKPLNEIIRLTQSGVDETIILTYVTNSPAVFTLGAEEIVYLNDLGLSSSVITAMMQHDQALKAAWANAAQPAAPTTAEPVAAAPTYVNAPQAAPAVETQPVYVSNDYFYNTLSPYGSWVEVDGYGRCWRPTVAISSSGWQPYRDRGRWVHTDAGWYWMSDYSWGSVAFHYGRWFSHPRWGWCWWPDTVWAPSWVTWRYDNDNCGWAPLPPRSYYRHGSGFYYNDLAVGVSFDFGLSVGSFTFVPWGRFCDPHPYRYCLPRPRSVAIYNQTTVINNVAVGNNNTVINRGIPTDRVRERTRTEVRTVRLREESARSLNPRAERFERDGRTLVVSRPRSSATADGGSSISPGERTRVAPTRAGEPVAVNPTTPPASGRPGISDRNERREIRPSRDNESRANGRTLTPNIITPASPTVVAAPEKPTTPTTPTAPATPIRSEPRPGRERDTRQPDDSANRTRPTSAPVVRVPETTPTPTPARTPTPIFSRPVVVERPAYTPTRQIAPTPAPNSSPSSPNTRANPVWNTPTPQPQPTAPASAPSYRNAPSRNQNNFATDNSPQIQSPQPVPSTPAYNRPNVESRREDNAGRNALIERSSRSRSEERNSAATYSAPAPRVSSPVSAPTPAPTPTPRPSYTPAPTPAPRVESQPAPSRSEPARTEPARSESRSESRSAPSSPGRNR